MSYNGWTNRETWLVSLYYGDHFAEVAEGAVAAGLDVYALAHQLEEEFYECESLPEAIEDVEDAGIIFDLLEPALDAIDWFEIAETLYADAVNELEG